MKLDCVLCLVGCCLVAVQAATLGKKEITVNVLYDDLQPELRSVEKNIEKKTVPLKTYHKKVKGDLASGIKSSYSRNLNEKVQLSEDELKRAPEHLPNSIELPKNVLKKESSSGLKNQVFLLKQARDVMMSSLRIIRQKIDQHPLQSQERRPSSDEWRKLEENIEQLYKKQEQLAHNLRQESNQNFIQTFINGIQNVTNSFVQNLNRPTNSSEEEQQPTIGQAIINYFQGGIQQTISTISNLGSQGSTSSTILGDTGVSSTETYPIISNVVNAFQNIFGTNNLNNNNQNDTGESNNNSPGIIQGAITQLNNVINNFNPSVQGDEGINSSAIRPPGQILQNFTNTISNAINQVNPFIQRPTNVPSDEVTGQRPTFIQNLSQQASNALNQVNPFAQRPTNATGDEGTGPRPTFIQNLSQQASNALNQVNPFAQRPPNASGEEGSGPRPTFIQNLSQQANNALNQVNPFAQRPPNSSSDGGTSQRPTLIQNLSQQANNVLNQVNPFVTRPPNSPSDEGTPQRPTIIQNIQNLSQALQNVVRPQSQRPQVETPNPIVSQIQNLGVPAQPLKDTMGAKTLDENLEKNSENIQEEIMTPAE